MQTLTSMGRKDSIHSLANPVAISIALGIVVKSIGQLVDREVEFHTRKRRRCFLTLTN